MKRFASLLLATCVTVTIPMQALATNQSSNDSSVGVNMAQVMLEEDIGRAYSSQENIDIVTSDLALLEDKLGSEEFTISQQNRDGSFVYAVDSVNGTEYIDIKEDEIGNVHMHVTDGTLHNDLTFLSDGQMILDGHKITFETTPVEPNILMPDFMKGSDILPRAAGFENTFSILSRMPSDYHYSGYRETANKVDLGKPLSQMLPSVLEAIIDNGMENMLKRAKFFAGGWNAVLESLLQELAESIARDMMRPNGAILREYGSSTFLSYVSHRFDQDSNNAVAKNYVYWFIIYPQANLSGEATATFIKHEQYPR